MNINTGRLTMQTKTVTSGFGIVIVDMGFVYVGDIHVDDDWCVITNAFNLRVWGTTKGLGQLAEDGPTATTVMDSTGTVRIPNHAIIAVIDTEQAKWTSK